MQAEVSWNKGTSINTFHLQHMTERTHRKILRIFLFLDTRKAAFCMKHLTQRNKIFPVSKKGQGRLHPFLAICASAIVLTSVFKNKYSFIYLFSTYLLLTIKIMQMRHLKSVIQMNECRNLMQALYIVDTRD